MTNDDNRANQLNPDHDAYWQSRGFEDREDAEAQQGSDGDGPVCCVGIPCGNTCISADETCHVGPGTATCSTDCSCACNDCTCSCCND